VTCALGWGESNKAWK